MTRRGPLLLALLSLCLAAVAVAAPVVGPAAVETLAASESRTALRFTFPLTDDASGVPAGVESLRFRSPRPVIDVVDGRAVYGEPRSTAQVAVPGTGAPVLRVSQVRWRIAPSGSVDPAEAVRVGAPQLHRGVPVATVSVRPRVGDGVLASLVLTVEHPPEPRFAALLDKAGEPGLRTGPAPTVANPELRERLARGAARANKALAAEKDATHPFDLTANWLRLEITGTGVHAVTGMHTALAGVGAASIDPETLRLYRAWDGALEELPEQPGSWQSDWSGLTEVAVDLDVAGADPVWDSASSLRFFAAGPDAWSDRVAVGPGRLEYREHPYADRVVYWLTWENHGVPSPLPGSPLRVEVRPALSTGGNTLTDFQHREHLEQNQIEAYGRFADDWAWDTAIDGIKPVPFNLSGVVAGRPAFFQAEVRSYQRQNDGTGSVVSAAAWLNDGDLLGQTAEGAWRIYNEDDPDSLRIRLAGWTDALDVGSNQLYVQNLDPAETHPILMLDSADILYRRSLIKGSGQFVFTHWGDEIAGSEGFDFLLAHPDADLGLWDVSDPERPVALQATAESATSTRIGAVRTPATDLHVQAWTESDLLEPAAVDRRDPGRLRAMDPQVDYVVLHPAFLTTAAQRLAAHRDRVLGDLDHDPVAVAVDVESVYDAFGSGVKDPAALRNFLKWLWIQGEGRLGYVCLMGDASRDHRDRRGQLPDLVPTHVRTYFPNLQVGYSYKPYATDDYLVSFEEHFFYPDAPDLAVGRLTVQTAAEAEAMVDRLIDYDDDPVAGDWRNRVVMVADDFTQPNSALVEIDHAEEAEILIDDYLPRTIDPVKVHLLDYEKAPGGEFKPGARQDAKAALNAGSTLFHYIGHGAETQLADEQVFLSDDIYGLNNGMRRGIFLAFSCDVGVFDSTTRPCMAEIFIGQPDGGAIGAIAASQVSYIGPNEVLSEAFYASLFPERQVRAGRSVAASLNDAKLFLQSDAPGSLSNSLRYNYLGDPGTALPHPVSDLVLAEASTDSLRASRRAEIVCVLSDHGVQAGPGVGYRLEVSESRQEKNATLGPVSLDYWLPGAVTFRGNGEALDDTLRIPFRVPSQLRFGVEGRARLILETPDGERAAVARLPVLRGDSSGLDDVVGPRIELAFENDRFRVKAGTPLQATVSDSSGVSVLGTTPMNSVLLEFDGSGQMSDVSDLFLFDSGSYTSGRVSIPLPANLESGDHRATLFASDVLGNVGTDTLSFRMVADAAVAIQDVALFPNPTPGRARLVFELSDPMEVDWTIHSLAGHPVRRIRRSFGEGGPQIIEWDGRDEEGDALANGVYLYVVRGRLPDDPDHPVRVTGKLVMMK